MPTRVRRASRSSSAGPLLHRLGHAFIPGLGGCDIGGRPIDFHFEVLRQFGATIEKRADGQYLEAPQRLRGTKIRLPYPSVGSTEQVLLTAVLAEGVTELSNAAVEPEIEDLICVLQKMGAIISMDTDRTIRITGCRQARRLHPPGDPDRLEAASWASAALATEGNIYVRGAQQRSMMTFLNTYRKVGGAFEIDDEGIRFWHPGGALNAIALETDVHPGFQTDWQQPLVVALTQAAGLSIVHETVYESRLGFTSALNQMGAHIQLYRECRAVRTAASASATSCTRRSFRADEAPGRRSGHPRPARRLLVPDRGAGGAGHLPGARHRPDQPRLRELHGEAGEARREGGAARRFPGLTPHSAAAHSTAHPVPRSLAEGAGAPVFPRSPAGPPGPQPPEAALSGPRTPLRTAGGTGRHPRRPARPTGARAGRMCPWHARGRPLRWEWPPSLAPRGVTCPWRLP
ncbi:UDP-N-acetylglucosamine 1-carboxyvinyltransferase [Streptomyces sp. CBG9]|uniref:UDP-N-acetylglucosamine 1-carboxyvinyltransferase n=1 Tax=Streptomyces sp. CBG9 TaxID=2762622 RepID=UPI0021BD68AD